MFGMLANRKQGVTKIGKIDRWMAALGQKAVKLSVNTVFPMFTSQKTKGPARSGPTSL